MPARRRTTWSRWGARMPAIRRGSSPESIGSFDFGPTANAELARLSPAVDHSISRRSMPDLPAQLAQLLASPIMDCPPLLKHTSHYAMTAVKIVANGKLTEAGYRRASAASSAIEMVDRRHVALGDDDFFDLQRRTDSSSISSRSIFDFRTDSLLMAKWPIPALRWPRADGQGADSKCPDRSVPEAPAPTATPLYARAGLIERGSAGTAVCGSSRARTARTRGRHDGGGESCRKYSLDQRGLWCANARSNRRIVKPVFGKKRPRLNQRFQPARAVSQRFYRRVDAVEHRELEVVERGFLVQLQVAARVDRVAAAAGQHDRQVVVVVALRSPMPLP